MIWPFRKRAPKPVHVGPETVDWEPGDMAECVFSPDLVARGFTNWPAIGQKLMVKQVSYGISRGGTVKAFWLTFIGFRPSDPTCGMRSDCFRKLTLTDTGADRKVEQKKPVRA